MPKLHPDLRPWTPGEGGGFDAVRAAHLLNRAGFGGTVEEVAAVQKLGVARAVDVLLDFPDAPASEQSNGDGPDWSTLADVPMTEKERQKAYALVRGDDTARQLQGQEWARASGEFMADATRWWVNRMAYGPYPLQERLTLFWHGHFTSSYRDDRQGAWRIWNQNELLRRYAAGNFRDVVKGVSRDAAMLKYLNNDQNRKGHPNENYARELMELFTLGVGNYTEDDVKQVARAFTGWDEDGVEFQFKDRQHDDQPKRIFGRTGNFGGDEVVDLLMAHPAAAPFVAGKLFSYFVGFEPDQKLSANLGDVLREANYELRPLLRVILGSLAFFDPARVGGKIKSPVHLLAGTARLMDMKVPNVPETRRELGKMGQTIFEPPNVKGWPAQYEGRKWINTATLLARYNFGVRMAGRAEVNARDGDAHDGESFVDEWLARLIPRPVSPEKRAALIAAAGDGRGRGDLQNVVKLIVSMPEYQLC